MMELPDTKATGALRIGPGEDLPIITIRPEKGWQALRLNELWEYRELFYFLIWRDVKVRYKQTALGAAWVILQPFMIMVAFSIFFGRLAKVPSDGLPYPIFAYTALLPWQLFAYAMTQSGNSLVANQQLILKVYFPRLIIPVAAVLAGLVDFAIAFLILLGMMLYYHLVPTLAVLTLPFFLTLALAAALSVGLWLSALNVKYRDIRYTLPFLVQFWLFVTPIAYPISIIPEPWRAICGLNPMAGVVEGFRWALLGKPGNMSLMMIVSILVVVGLLLGGLIYFRRTEKFFADMI